VGRQTYVQCDGIRCHQDPQGAERILHPGHQEEHHRHLPGPQLHAAPDAQRPQEGSGVRQVRQDEGLLQAERRGEEARPQEEGREKEGGEEGRQEEGAQEEGGQEARCEEDGHQEEARHRQEGHHHQEDRHQEEAHHRQEGRG
ncbi:unnamed protein product, partial [Ectocarpus fasciculatus]